MKWKSETSFGKYGNARKYFLDEHFFDVIDSENKAYWLGFISADGCIRKDDKQLSISLMPQDSNHLYKFSKDLNSNYPVYMYKDKCSIVVTSTTLVNSLVNLGVTPRKSFSLKVCTKIPKNLLLHYYRGLVDGDGCLYKRPDGFFEIGLVGTYSICESFRCWLIAKGINIKAKTNSIRTFYGIRANGRNLPKAICELLYRNSNVFLDRKYKLAMEIINA